MYKRALRFVLKKLSQSSDGHRLLVFAFHNVLNDQSPTPLIGTKEEVFFRQMEWISRNFTILPLSDAVDLCQQRKLSGPTAAITFDDGYRTHHTIASEWMHKRDIPGTFFVTSGHLGKSILWNDWLGFFLHSSSQKSLDLLEAALTSVGSTSGYSASVSSRANLELRMKYLTVEQRQRVVDMLDEHASVPTKRIMMDKADLEAMCMRGFDIGGHTLDHPILRLESHAVALEQIGTDIENLRRLTGKPVTSFAFPNGLPLTDYDDSHLDILRQLGVERAVTSVFGNFSASDDVMQIRRVALQGSSSSDFLRTVGSAYMASHANELDTRNRKS